jgi:hypothetical protein
VVYSADIDAVRRKLRSCKVGGHATDVSNVTLRSGTSSVLSHDYHCLRAGNAYLSASYIYREHQGNDLIPTHSSSSSSHTFAIHQMPGLTTTATATQRSDTSQSDLSQLKRTADGAFDRVVSTFRDTISSEPGARFPPEAGRYRLYVCLGCPWATRTIIVRSLMGLEDIIPVTVTSVSRARPE